MKFALALLALVATASAIELPNFGRGELHPVLQEFLDLVPVKKVVQITLQYYIEDKDFQKMVEYFRSEGFKQLVQDVEALPEIKVFMDYIHNAGIDIYKIVNDLNSALKLPPLTAPSYFGTYITGGINGYIQDILNVLPRKELRDLYEEKLTTSKAFADLIAQLKSDNFQQIVNKVYVHPKFQELLTHARTEGIDLIAIKELLEVLWGIKVPTY
ncbi:Protein G12 [Trachymyrmex septentrionalis]|uniref:Protein G12 n=1 Tax=Trachymyrmex septentrionalis TaxID=34720 RepID=A0A151JU60_9HYME|nr:PREDICTED: protein G12-like [Trachymyrmex septentrionalis]KYN35782.1 Protein G12 [Trachymyrmex septentrionalis]